MDGQSVVRDGLAVAEPGQVKMSASRPASRGKSGSGVRAPGRPPKFDEPRRPVTVTLPERTLRHLESLDTDRAQAIVKATEALLGFGPAGPQPVEFVEIAPGKAIIIVGPCASLRSIPWLELVETAPGRNMLIIPSGTAVETLEVAILDLLEKGVTIGDGERGLLERLRHELGRLRRDRRISKAEIIFFDIRPAGVRRAGGRSGKNGAKDGHNDAGGTAMRAQGGLSAASGAHES